MFVECLRWHMEAVSLTVPEELACCYTWLGRARAICGSKPPAWCIPDSVCWRSDENELACENAECV